MEMFSRYSALVLEDYRKKKDIKELSLNLLKPSPAKLRSECLFKLSTGLSAGDSEILRLFFGPKDDVAELERTIRNSDSDRFKPLSNFLNGKTSTTDEKNIELLAWLIDFQPRPYQSYLKSRSTEDKQLAVVETKHETLDVAENSDLNIIESTSRGFLRTAATLFRQKRTVVNMFAALIAVIIIYLLWPSKQCMYWAGDHYEPVSCNEKIPNTLAIALDQDKVDEFKKITKPDTITYNSLGYVWYSKIDKKIEYFTSGGAHPVHDDRYLRPVTKYIIDKYVKGEKKNVGNESD